MMLLSFETVDIIIVESIQWFMSRIRRGRYAFQWYVRKKDVIGSILIDSPKSGAAIQNRVRSTVLKVILLRPTNTAYVPNYEVNTRHLYGRRIIIWKQQFPHKKTCFYYMCSNEKPFKTNARHNYRCLRNIARNGHSFKRPPYLYVRLNRVVTNSLKVVVVSSSIVRGAKIVFLTDAHVRLMNRQ